MPPEMPAEGHEGGAGVLGRAREARIVRRPESGWRLPWSYPGSGAAPGAGASSKVPNMRSERPRAFAELVQRPADRPGGNLFPARRIRNVLMVPSSATKNFDLAWHGAVLVRPSAAVGALRPPPRRRRIPLLLILRHADAPGSGETSCTDPLKKKAKYSTKSMPAVRWAISCGAIGGPSAFPPT